MGIEVLPPDVNSSDHGFVVAEKKIASGSMRSRTSATPRSSDPAAREDGQFRSLWDFCERVDARAVNKRATECLIKWGAGLDRRQPPGDAGMLPAASRAVRRRRRSAARPGLDLRYRRGGGGPPAGFSGRRFRPPSSTSAKLLRLEKETLGTYLSSHPLADVRDALRARVDCTLVELQNKATLLGDGWRHRHRAEADPNKERRPDDVRTLDDVEGQVEMLVFNSAYASNAETIDADAVVVVRGRVDHRTRETKLVVQEAERFEPGPTRSSGRNRTAP